MKKAPKILTLSDAEYAMNALLKLDAKLDAASAKANTAVAAINEKFVKDTSGVREEAEAIRVQLQAFAEANKGANIFEGKKSITLAAGPFGFREAPPSIELQPGITEDVVVSRAMQYGFASVVKPGKPTLDKGAAKRLSNDELNAIGLYRTEATDSFFANVKGVEK